jgi:hypothetical protein
MIKLLKRIETLLVAASFAEEGEFETARQIMKEETLRKTDRPSSYKHKRTSTRPTTRAD